MASDLHHHPQAGGASERTPAQEGMFTPNERVMKLHVEPLLGSAETQAELGFGSTSPPQIMSPISGRALQTSAAHSPGVLHRAGFVPPVPGMMMMSDAFSPSSMTQGGGVGRGVKISLESKNEQREEAAAISIELDNNEEMISKVLDILSARFPLDAFYRAMQNRAGMIREVCAEDRISQNPVVYTDGVSQTEGDLDQENLRGKWREIIAEADPQLLKALSEAGQTRQLTKTASEKRMSRPPEEATTRAPTPSSPLQETRPDRRSQSVHSTSNSSAGSGVHSRRVDITHHAASRLASNHSSHNSSRHVMPSTATASVILAPPLSEPVVKVLVEKEKPLAGGAPAGGAAAAGEVVTQKKGVGSEVGGEAEFQEEGKWQELAEEECLAEIETQHSKTITSESASSLMQSNHTEENKMDLKAAEGFLGSRKQDLTKGEKQEAPKGESKSPSIVGRGSSGAEGVQKSDHLQGKLSSTRNRRAMSGTASEMSVASSAKSSHLSTIYQQKRYSTVHPFIAKGFGKFPAVFAQFALSVAPSVLGEILKMNRDNGHRVAAMADSLRCNPVMIIGLMDYVDKTYEFKQWCEMLLHLDADLSPIDTQQEGNHPGSAGKGDTQAKFSIYRGDGASYSAKSEQSNPSSRCTTELLSPEDWVGMELQKLKKSNNAQLQTLKTNSQPEPCTTELLSPEDWVGIELQNWKKSNNAQLQTLKTNSQPEPSGAKALDELPLASASATKYRTELELALEAEDQLIRSKVDVTMKALFQKYQVPNSEVQMDLGSVETQANNIEVLMNKMAAKYEHLIETTRREVYEGIRDMLHDLGYRCNIAIQGGESRPRLGEDVQHEGFSSDYVSRLDRTVQEATVRLAIVSLAENLKYSSLSESGQFSDLLIDVLNTPRLGGVARRQHEDIAKIINTHRTRSLKSALNASIDSVAWKPIVYETLLRNVERVICRGPSFIEPPPPKQQPPAHHSNIGAADQQQHQSGHKPYHQANTHQGVGSHASSGPYDRPQMATTPSSPSRSLAPAQQPITFPHGDMRPGNVARPPYPMTGGLPHLIGPNIQPMKQTPLNLHENQQASSLSSSRPAMHTVSGVQGTMYCHTRGAAGQNMAGTTGMLNTQPGGAFAPNPPMWQGTSPTNCQPETSRMEKSSHGTDQVSRSFTQTTANSQLANVGSTLTDMGAKLTSMGQSVHMMEAALTPPHSRSPTHYLVARTDLVSARPYSVAEAPGDMSPRMQTSPRTTGYARTDLQNITKTGTAPPQVIYGATATSEQSGMRVNAPTIIAAPMQSLSHQVDQGIMQETSQPRGHATQTTTTISTATDSRFTSTPTKLASTQSHEESYIGHSAASAYSTIPIRDPSRPATTTSSGSLPHNSGNLISNPRASPLAKMQSNNNILGQIISHYRDSEPRRDF